LRDLGPLRAYLEILQPSTSPNNMITLHRLAHADEPFDVNPDLVVTVESHPDTVLTLATGQKLLVAESAEEVRQAVLDWRADIMSTAFRRSNGR
jgi:flagellar protein FlbD